MNIVYGYPPVWDRAVKELGATERTVFTYGDTIYIPSGKPLDPMLRSHENVHIYQQRDGAQEWWDRYFEDANFRYAEELAAYKVQYKTFCLFNTDRNQRAKYRTQLAGTLAGKLYGRVVSFSEAFVALDH